MDALSVGPFVLSAPRLYAAVALLLLIVLAELGAWRRRARAARDGGGSAEAASDASWAWNAAFVVVAGARLGFIMENLDYYARQPLQAFAVWQGGFSPWWGVAAAAVLTTLWLRRRRVSVATVALPSLVALFAWLLVPQLLSPAGGPVAAFPTGALSSMEGERFDFASAGGRPVVVNVWATWCIPCRREMPQLARAAQEHPEVSVIYVNQGESQQKVAAFLSEHPTVDAGAVLLDSNQRVGNALGSVGLPTTYFFAADGSHVKTHVGEISGPALTREMRALTAAQ